MTLSKTSTSQLTQKMKTTRTSVSLKTTSRGRTTTTMIQTAKSMIKVLLNCGITMKSSLAIKAKERTRLARVR